MMPRLPKIAIIYASGQGRTRLMAESIAEGARTVAGIDILLKDVSLANPEDIKDADVIFLGGSTYHKKLIETMNPFLEMMEKLDLKDRSGVAFGSYGWSGEGVPTLIEKMKSMGMKITEPGIKVMQQPNNEVIKSCFMLGKKLADEIKQVHKKVSISSP